MSINNHENKDFASDIDYHISEIETDLYRAKYDNNRNVNLLRLFDNILSRINLMRMLIISEPKAYFNTIYSEMKRLFNEATGDLDGFYVKISFKKDPNPSRMGNINLLIDKKLMKDEE
jgi:hypothetical protein